MTDRDLVVAYNFPPFVDASAVTVAKRVIERAQPVDVICQDLTGIRVADSSLYSIVAPFVMERHVITGPPKFLDWISIRQFARSGLRRVSAARSLSTYRSVYSRSMWPHSHILAATVALASPRTSWRAEFSDPLLRNVDGSPRRSPLLTDDPLTRQLVSSLPLGYQQWVERGGELLHLIQAVPFALASEIVFTNEQQRTVMINDIDDDVLGEQVLRKSVISPHPVPPASWVGSGSSRPADSRRSQKRTIGYFGTLYPNRGLGTLIDASRLLPLSVRRRLQIDIYTDRQAMLYQLFRENMVDDILKTKPSLQYLDFLKVAAGYDYLLATDTQGGDFPVANPFLPSKLSDYEAVGRPVLAISVPGSELDQRSVAIKARVGDVLSLKSALIAASGSIQMS